MAVEKWLILGRNYTIVLFYDIYVYFTKIKVCNMIGFDAIHYRMRNLWSVTLYDRNRSNVDMGSISM